MIKIFEQFNELDPYGEDIWNTNDDMYKNVTNQLIKRRWKLDRVTDRHDIYFPPNELGFEKNYRLYVPNNLNKMDYENNIYHVASILRDIYEEDIHNFLTNL